MGKVMVISEREFEEQVLRSPLPVLVDFYADWCGPCHAVAPIIEQLAQEYDGRMRFVKVNVDEAQQLAMKYGVMSIPTLIIFKDGKVVDSFVGATTKAQYVRMIERALS